MGPDAMILVFWMLNFKSAFSLSFCTFKRLFSSSLLSAIRVVSPAYLKLLMFLLAILILACDSSSWLVFTWSFMKVFCLLRELSWLKSWEEYFCVPSHKSLCAFFSKSSQTLRYCNFSVMTIVDFLLDSKSHRSLEFTSFFSLSLTLRQNLICWFVDWQLEGGMKTRILLKKIFVLLYHHHRLWLGTLVSQLDSTYWLSCQRKIALDGVKKEEVLFKTIATEKRDWTQLPWDKGGRDFKNWSEVVKKYQKTVRGKVGQCNQAICVCLLMDTSCSSQVYFLFLPWNLRDRGNIFFDDCISKTWLPSP